MDWIFIFEKGIWFGLAATGFAVLFNVPTRTLIAICLMGALGGLTKTIMMHFDFNVIVASFSGATVVGFLSIFFAHDKHAPPPILAIPAVIPMVPGILAYRMMIGLINLAGKLDNTAYLRVLSETTNNGFKVMFILMGLATGVGLPMLITRKESAKDLRFKRNRKVND